MKRVALIVTLLAALFALPACPGPGGKIDPWLTAKTIILQTQNAVFFADGIFNQWLLGQPEDQRDAVKAKFLKVRQAVVNGLQLALDGVDIAEQAKKDPDVKKLMEAADKAWADLKKFLSELLDKPGPASQPGLRATPVDTLKKDLARLPKSLFKTRPTP